jgi:hypothetical protein
MLYEIRRYVCVPGKRAAVLMRFDEVVLPLFERHGVEIDRFWVDRDDGDVFVYVCPWQDEQTIADTWDAFQADPDWIEAKAASEANEGPTVERIERSLATAWR